MQAGFSPALPHSTTTQGNEHCRLFLAHLLSLNSATQQCQLRDGSNTRQRFTAKSQGMQAFQIFDAADLARTMARAGSFQFIFGNAISIVRNPDQPQPAASYFNAHLASSRVKRILHQFFHHRYRPLDHFTRRYAFRDILG
jgi:hypothetical protein